MAVIPDGVDVFISNRAWRALGEVSRSIRRLTFDLVEAASGERGTDFLSAPELESKVARFMQRWREIQLGLPQQPVINRLRGEIAELGTAHASMQEGLQVGRLQTGEFSRSLDAAKAVLRRLDPPATAARSQHRGAVQTGKLFVRGLARFFQMPPPAGMALLLTAGIATLAWLHWDKPGHQETVVTV